MTHAKCLKAAVLMSFAGIRPDDIIYTPLPLYHSAGGLIGVGNTIAAGETARSFRPDVFVAFIFQINTLKSIGPFMLATCIMCVTHITFRE